MPDPRLLVEIVDVIDSTNSELLRREPLLPPQSTAEAIWLVAREQTAGRGRRERTWVSSGDDSLTASFAREVAHPSHLGALSLVAGLAVARVLEDHGVPVRLKWPNDLYVGAGKAGGILCEARARGSVTRLVIGCGLNLRAPSLGVGQATSGLFEDDASARPEQMAAALGIALLEATDRLLREGFEPFRQAWSAHDMLLARPIVIHDYRGETTGIARGIDTDGALLVELDHEPGSIKRIVAEEVSVRTLSE